MPHSLHTPKLCHHKATGQAYVTLDGKERYLGTFGSADAQEAYDRVISEWFGNGRTLVAAAGGDARPSTDFTITELVAGFWEHAQKHYRKPKRKTAAKGTKGNLYPVSSYRNAIARGCDKADDSAKKSLVESGQKVPTTRIVPKWHPHQLRHTAATRIREASGAEAAAVVMGHSKIDMTLEYAKRTQEMQRKIAAGGR